jgi:hypothetical protein
MRLLLASTAIALLIGLSPASAAMCGGGGQQATAGGMCGGSGGGMKNMSEWPARDVEGQKPAEGQKQAMGMCGCCKDMAMMGGMKADDPHKGMDMPKQ